MLFGDSQEARKENVVQKQLFKDQYEHDESDSNFDQPKNYHGNINYGAEIVMNSEEKEETKNGFTGVSTNFNANSNITNCSSNLQ